MNVSYLEFPNHVSDVQANMAHHVDHLSRHDDPQLELDLGDRACRIMKIAATESLHGQTLSALIDQVSPEFVLDLRDVLRFNLPGLSRDVFFHMLSARGVHYARVPIGWHSISPKAVTAGAPLPARLQHEAIERWGGNLVLLVSRNEHALHTQAMLNMALSSHRSRGWRIERVS
ncbi:hypothetical protein [Sphingomonas sp. Marseille-Q8236]